MIFVKLEDVEVLRNSTIGKVCNNACQGTGTLLKDDTFYDCVCVEEFKKKLKFLQANIPKKYWEFDLRNLTKEFCDDNRIPLNILKKYTSKIKEMSEEGVGLYIQGASGLAKTALSYYVLKEGLKKDLVCYSISMSHLTKILFDISINENKERIDFLKNSVELLLIDEIEKDYNLDKPTSYLGALVNDFFRGVYDNKKALIITSNLPKKDLESKKIHAANVVDRFEELVDVILVGKSFRRQNTNLKYIIG